MTKLKLFWQKRQAELLIVLLSLLAYGLMIPWLGFFVDDWTFTWAYQLYGSQGLFTYFSANRPFWGLTYQLTMPLLQDNILAWHIFGLVCRIIVSLSFYWLMKLVWPQKKTLTLSAGLLFAVYPGFLLQPIALCFGHIWLVFTSFILSNCFTVLALRHPSRRSGFTIAAVLLSLYNILSMEYFLPLEILRLLLLFILLAEPQPFFKRLGRAFRQWLPYLAALSIVTVYRAFFYHDQTHTYSLHLLDTFKHSLSAGIVQLWNELAAALYQSAVYAWVQPFTSLASRFNLGRIYLGILVLAVLLFGGLTYFLIRRRVENEGRRMLSPLVVAVFALLLAGIPFYVTSLPVEASAINSRFTMPFMVGAALLLAFLLELIPVRWLQAGLLSLILAAAVGFNLQNSNDFRLVSVKNNELMYEIAWRAPDLKPGTLLVTSEQSQSVYFTYATLRSELNLIYPHNPASSFGWVYSRDLASMIPTPVAPGTAITIPAFVVNYTGSSSNAAVFQLSDYGCARFVDSNSTFVNKEISDYSLQKISQADNLLGNNGQTVILDKKLIGPEPAHGWCYYFEKSDLALQEKDYAAIQQNYQTVTKKSLKPYYGYEWFPFIKGLAGAGDWSTALSLAQQVIAANPTNDSYQPFICQALTEISAQAKDPGQAKAALDSLNCQK